MASIEYLEQFWWIPLTIVLSSFSILFFRRAASGPSSSLRVHALRLTPGQEIKSTLLDYCRQNSIEAAFILTCVGSLSNVHLRYAYSAGEKTDMESWSKGENIRAEFEILSMVGTISNRGSSCHIHLSLGDGDGRTRGGHLIGEAIVRTTAEIVLGQCDSFRFSLEHDSRTGFPELVVKKKLW